MRKIYQTILECGSIIKMIAFKYSTQKSDIGFGVGLVKHFQALFVAWFIQG